MHAIEAIEVVYLFISLSNLMHANTKGFYVPPYLSISFGVFLKIVDLSIHVYVISNNMK